MLTRRVHPLISLRGAAPPATQVACFAASGEAEASQGEQILGYWQSLLLDHQNSGLALDDNQLRELFGTAIRLRQGKAASTLPEQLVAVFVGLYSRLQAPGRLQLLRNLTRDFGVQQEEVAATVAAWQQAAARHGKQGEAGSERGHAAAVVASAAAAAAAAEAEAEALGKAAARLAAAAQPLYSRLFVPISQQESGIKLLVDMRADVLECVRRHPAGSAPLRALSEALRQSLAEWFSIGLMQLRRLTWEDTPAALLEKVMEYEAVHRMADWADLRRRLGPARRVFAFFHPAMPQEPLVVLHTALVAGLPPGSMGEIFSGVSDSPQEPTTAVFYSISSTQKGLTGVDLGNFLIKQVAHRLLQEFPSLATLCTLSPMPGFADWLDMRVARGLQGLDPDPLLLPSEMACLWPLAEGHLPAAARGEEVSLQRTAAVVQWAVRDDHWLQDRRLEAALKPALMRLGAAYLVRERRRALALDPVANFHLRNGAELWRLNWRGDVSPAGLARSHGLMVNYRYDLAQVAANNRRYLVDGEVVAGPQVLGLLARVGEEK